MEFVLSKFSEETAVNCVNLYTVHRLDGVRSKKKSVWSQNIMKRARWYEEGWKVISWVWEASQLD